MEWEQLRSKTEISEREAEAISAIKAAEERAKRDEWRPVFHFRPPAQWMNDPNGTIYHEGWYHVFYQFNPYGDKWGNIHWGHTRSRDLVHWEHLPIALWPSLDKGEEHCFSGCVAITDSGQPMALYTSIGPNQRVLDSAQQWGARADGELIHWEKHPDNPILSEAAHGGEKILEWRDPFVFHEGSRTFLVLGGKLVDQGKDSVVLLYEAKDGEMSQWEYKGVLFRHPDKELRSVECPNFFKLENKWLLLDSPYGPVEYFAGRFDPGTPEFAVEHTGLIDQTQSFYATNVIFDESGRCILLGWIRGFREGRGWNGCLALPRVLSWDRDGNLMQRPIQELETLRGKETSVPDFAVSSSSTAIDARVDGLELYVTIGSAGAESFGLRIGSGIDITCDSTSICVGDTEIPRKSTEDIRFHIFVDRSVAEVFIDDKECVTKVIYPTEAGDGVQFFADNGTAEVKGLQLWEMKPVW